MNLEDIGHAWLTDWAEWTIRCGHRSCLWYPGSSLREKTGNGIAGARVPHVIAPARVNAVAVAVMGMPPRMRDVVSAKYLVPGDDAWKWTAVGASRATWYRELVAARRLVARLVRRARWDASCQICVD